MAITIDANDVFIMNRALPKSDRITGQRGGYFGGELLLLLVNEPIEAIGRPPRVGGTLDPANDRDF